MQRLACLFTVMVFSASSQMLHAESAIITSSFGRVDKITIYATRSPQSSFDVSAITSIVEADSAGNAMASHTADLPEFIPPVEIDNGPRRNGQTISIRGFDDEAIITLIGYLHGGGAIGGVVAFETKDAANLLAPGNSFGALTAMTIRTATDDYAPTTSVYDRASNWDMVASMTYRHADNLQ